MKVIVSTFFFPALLRNPNVLKHKNVLKSVLLILLGFHITLLKKILTYCFSDI